MTKGTGKSWLKDSYTTDG